MIEAPLHFNDRSSYEWRFLLLPTGQVLVTDGSSMVQIYTGGGTFKNAWMPTITDAPTSVTPGNTYRITGTQFNGLSGGAAYGDDAQSSTNYPLIRFTNRASGRVRYGRTHDHSTMGVATAGQTVWTLFDVPSDIELGLTDVVIVANGIASKPVSLEILDPSIVDGYVSFVPRTDTFSSMSPAADCPAGFAGKFSFVATLASKSSTTHLSGLFIKVNTLSSGALLQNSDAGPAGAGATLSIAGALGPGETIDVPIEVCLRSMAPFQFLVDVWGSIDSN
jgi:hypothetical protein